MPAALVLLPDTSAFQCVLHVKESVFLQHFKITQARNEKCKKGQIQSSAYREFLTISWVNKEKYE